MNDFLKELRERINAQPCRLCVGEVREKFNTLSPEQRQVVTVDYLALMRTR